MSEWKRIGAADDQALVEFRLQAHNALQWANKASRGLLPAKSDDSHTNMEWSSEFGALLTHPLGKTGVQVGLAFERFAFVVVAKGGLFAERQVSGYTDADIGDWLGDILRGLSEDPGEALTKELPYEIPFHRVQKGEPYSLDGLDDAAQALSHWFANADLVLRHFLKGHGQLGLGPSSVRCWPHHLDIATLIYLEEGDPEKVRSIGIGMAPGDSAYVLPYFYVSPWPMDNVENLPPLQTLGHWHTEGFTSIVLPTEAIRGAEDQDVAVTSYIDGSVRLCLEVLGTS